MLYNTVELIIQASSNFHFVFCFCNLIILFVLVASSLSSPVEYNLEATNALSVRGDDHGYDEEDEHNSVKSEPSFDSQDGILDKGTLDDHNMASQEVGGDDDDDDDDDDGETAFEEQRQPSAVSSTAFEEQRQPSADSIEEGSKEIEIYAAFSPANGDIKATLEDQTQNREEEEEEEGGGRGGCGGEDDELRRKIEDFINRVNNSWKEEKLVRFE